MQTLSPAVGQCAVGPLLAARRRPGLSPASYFLSNGHLDSATVVKACSPGTRATVL